MGGLWWGCCGKLHDEPIELKLYIIWSLTLVAILCYFDPLKFLVMILSPLFYFYCMILPLTNGDLC